MTKLTWVPHRIYSLIRITNLRKTYIMYTCKLCYCHEGKEQSEMSDIILGTVLGICQFWGWRETFLSKQHLIRDLKNKCMLTKQRVERRSLRNDQNQVRSFVEFPYLSSGLQCMNRNDLCVMILASVQYFSKHVPLFFFQN